MAEKMEFENEPMDTSISRSHLETTNETSMNITSTTQSDTTIRPVVKSVKVPSNYFDICDILAMSERVPCQIEQDLVKMGYLDQSTDDEHLAKGTKLELPLWFAKEFHTEQIRVIKIEAPKGYNETFRQIFAADATVVNLNAICPNFYKFGQHLVELNFKESKLIAETLMSAFFDRIHYLIEYSLNAKTEFIDHGINFKKKLDNLELQLYNLGKKELNQIQKWEANELHKIDTNEFVTNMKKRKQAACTVGLYKS